MSDIIERELKDAAEKGEKVNFRVAYVQEKMSKSGNSMIMCGLACTDSSGNKLDKLLYNYLVGTPGAARFIPEFLNSLDKDMTISYEGDSWICDYEDLKQRTGSADLFIDENGFVKANWILADRSTADKEEQGGIVNDALKSKADIIDDEIPF